MSELHKNAYDPSSSVVNSCPVRDDISGSRKYVDSALGIFGRSAVVYLEVRVQCTKILKFVTRR